MTDRLPTARSLSRLGFTVRVSGARRACIPSMPISRR
jgi:hypothetical protein